VPHEQRVGLEAQEPLVDRLLARLADAQRRDADPASARAGVRDGLSRGR
jgi:hypothetical protein